MWVKKWMSYAMKTQRPSFSWSPVGLSSLLHAWTCAPVIEKTQAGILWERRPHLFSDEHFLKTFPRTYFLERMSAITAKRLSDNKVFHGPRMLDRSVNICVRRAVFCAKRDVLSSRRDASVKKQKVSLPIALRKRNCGCLPYKNTGQNAQTACLKRRKTQNTDRRAATAHLLEALRKIQILMIQSCEFSLHSFLLPLNRRILCAKQNDGDSSSRLPFCWYLHQYCYFSMPHLL